MKKNLKFWDWNKTSFTEKNPDYERSVVDLAYDVKQKRKLIGILLKRNRQLRTVLTSFITFAFVASFSLIILGGSITYSRTFNKYYKEFKHRYIYGLGFSNTTEYREALKFVDEYKVNLETKMLRALLCIDKKEFPKALFLLSEIESPEARWLEALCYLKIKEDKKAEIALKNIIVENNLFSPDALEIIEKHYNNKHTTD
jgi:hypothetical protein